MPPIHMGNPNPSDALNALGADPSQIEELLSAHPQLRHLPVQGQDLLLHLAAAQRNLAAVRILLQYGADPNARGEGGYTALHYAVCDATSDDFELVELLLASGANVNARDIDGATPLDHLSRGYLSDTTHVASLLFKHGASRSLEFAMRQGDTEYIRSLVGDKEISKRLLQVLSTEAALMGRDEIVKVLEDEVRKRTP